MKTLYKKVTVTKEAFKNRDSIVWCDLCLGPRRPGTIMHIFFQEGCLAQDVSLCHRHLQFIARRAS